jgi:ABC-2 type transport system permease protein
MNWSAIGVLARRDLTAVRRSRAVVAPMIVLPVIISALLPGIAALIPRLSASMPGADVQASLMLRTLTPSMRAAVAGLTPDAAMIILIGVYTLAPIFLLLPMIVASVIAADSIAGERERKTLEALLYTPVGDAEIFVAKTLVAWLPALAVTAISFVVYAIVLNVAAWPTMGRVFFPNAMWGVLIIWVAPAVAALGLSVTVLISVRVRGMQEATQLSGVLAVPIVALVISQVRGSMMLGVRTLLVAGAVTWLASGIVLWYGSRSMKRDQLIAKT